MLDRGRGLLFLMAPRTGCTAIASVMESHWGATRIPPSDVRDDAGNVTHWSKHNTATQLLEDGFVTPQELERWTVFTTVRNPFDSLVSLYVKQRTKYQPLLENPESWVNQKPEYRERMLVAVEKSFPEWLQQRRPKLWKRPLSWGRDRLIGPRPTHLYGRFLAHSDVVLRFEHLQEGLSTMLGSLGIPDVEIPVVNPTVQRDEDYRSYYDEASRRYVERRYAADLDRFGYSF